MTNGVKDLEPEDENRTFSVQRPVEGSSSYSPSGPGGVSLTPGSGFSVRSIDDAYKEFIMTGVVPSDAVLGYEVGALAPQGISYELLESVGLQGINENELMMLATKGLEILGSDTQLRVELADRDRAIRRSEIVNALPERNLGYLAMDMFLNVDGAYRDIDEVFDDDGMVNMQQFNFALERTFQEAIKAGPGGFGTTAEFLDILTENRDLTIEEMQALFDEREAEIRAEEAPSIVLYDPVGLAAAAKEGFVGSTGRRATKAEQQGFVRKVHGLQRSGQRSIDVAAQLEEFARKTAPVEAAAMDEATAGSILMDVIRSRR